MPGHPRRLQPVRRHVGHREFAASYCGEDATFNGLDWVDADAHVTVCCGATECMMATLLALIDPGDEVVIFQPFYENYGPDAKLTGATPKWVPLHPPNWSFDPDELRAAFSPRTKAVILNTPNNPTGKVFTRERTRIDREFVSRV